MKILIIGLALASLSLPVVGNDYWYFTHARGSNMGFKPEFSFSGILQCKEAPRSGSQYGEFTGANKHGPFKTQEEADNALDRDIKRVQLVDPEIKLIRKNASC
ncbi:MAG: hypothetical protein ACK4GU_03735 [Alishewanella aestuarii]|jgi:hypothetical protein